MRLLFSLTLFFVFSWQFLSAQVVLHTSQDTTKKRTGIKVSVLNPNGKKPIPYAGHAMHSDSVQQAIKICPTGLLRGEFALYYEYRLADAFSIEGAAGITHIDYLYEMVENDGRFIFNSDEANSVKFYSGYAGRFQFRYYVSKYETAITGFYFAPEISYRSYKMNYFINTGLINEPHPVNRKYTCLKLQFGHQGADPYENLFWEWYLAAGFQKFDGDAVRNYRQNIEFTHSNYWSPAFSAGIKLGFTL